MDARLVHDVIAELERQRGDLDALIAKLRAECEVAGDRPISGRWTDTEDARLLHLVEGMGKTHEDAAKVLGRTTDAVSKRLSRLREGG
jgi:DNA-directed RNA polymerase specialized sigma24 family protein